MMNKRVDKKPSKTALFAALRRAIAYQEFNNGKFGPDSFAQYFLPPHFRFFLRFKKIRANTQKKLNRFVPGGNEYMIARTAYFDKLFINALNQRIPQIVLLGAGYDSRPYRFERSNHGTKIFELDIASTQSRKQRCIKKAGIDIPKFVTYVPLNFNVESVKSALEKAGYHVDQKTLFIWEGVSYYLEMESVDKTLEFVSRTSHNENSIAFDYIIPISKENIDDYCGAKEFAQTMKDHHSSEAIMFSIDEGDIESFLAKRGLKIVDHLENENIERTFLLKENGTLLGRITGHFRFVLASPQKHI